MYDYVIQNIIKLSSSKLGSQLVVSVLEINEKLRGRIIYEFFLSRKILSVSRNKFANYVIDNMTVYLNNKEKFELISLMLNDFIKDDHSQKDYEELKYVLDKLRWEWV